MKDPNIELGKLPGFVNAYEGYTLEQALASVGKGWAPLIEKVFEEKPEITKITQVKEKFGGLRIYWSNAIDYAWIKIVDDAENESYKICEWCGNPGSIDKRYYWLLTLCTSCKRKRKREKDAKSGS